MLAARRWMPAYPLTPPRTAMALGIILVPKLGQEYALHYARWLDNLVAFEVISDAWEWVREHVPSV